ncbi:MAG: MotA/TolQ/ExbB proton channel family protein [Candidatus Latescibacterota bacterium]|nr:MAG: MotA/TolQ/ExbB proton channel family protein [Candidatus Latescibacterota bacterium]
MFSSFSWMDAMTSSPIVLVLAICSVVTLGAALERIYYYAKRRGNPDGTFRKAVVRVREGKLREAEMALESSMHPVGPVGLEVLRGADKPAETFEERLHIALSAQRLLLERNLNVLGTMAAVAPLIGLFGTVWGIMRAFSDMAQTGSAAPSVVAAGVAEALVTTAAGLVVAVPALMLYNHLSRRMNVMLTVAENQGRSLRTVIVEENSRRLTEAPAKKRGVGHSMQSRRVDEILEPEPAATR